MPPEVEPAQPHIIDTIINITIANGVQKLVSVVAKPVVVMSDTTWNVESCIDVLISVYVPEK
jgi:hypothetical protein